MNHNDKIRMMNSLSRIHGMLTVLACMEGATITKKMTVELEDTAERMGEMLGDIYDMVVNGDEIMLEISGIVKAENPDQ